MDSYHLIDVLKMCVVTKAFLLFLCKTCLLSLGFDFAHVHEDRSCTNDLPPDPTDILI